MIKPGDIVRTPAVSGLHSNQLALVLRATKAAVTLRTGSAELMYEPEDVTLVARIVFTSRYGTLSGRRFQRFVLERADGTSRRGEVLVRENRGDGEITSRQDMRVLVLQKMKAGEL